MTEAPLDNIIQPVGLHVQLSDDWRVRAISANSADLVGAAAEDLLEAPITDLFESDTVHSIRNRIALLRDKDAAGHVLNCQFERTAGHFDLTVGRSGNGYAIDAEPSPGQPFGDAVGVVGGMAAMLDRCADAEAIRDMAVRQLRGLTGFDHATIDSAHAPGLAVMIVDCNAPPIAMLGKGAELGRSLLRAPSPTEVEQLCGADARAALVVPLDGPKSVVGSIICTHRLPRHVGVERRGIVMLFARFVALKLMLADRG